VHVFDRAESPVAAAPGLAPSHSEQIAAHVAKLRRQGVTLHPVSAHARQPPRGLWARAWWDHLGHQADFATQLEPGRALVRAGAVIHLEVQPGVLHARISAGNVYAVQVIIPVPPPAQRGAIARLLRGQAETPSALLQAQASPETLQAVRSPSEAILPWLRDMTLACSCLGEPFCRHVAAALYAAGVRFDAEPESFFALRQLDPLALFAGPVRVGAAAARASAGAPPPLPLLDQPSQVTMQKPSQADSQAPAPVALAATKRQRAAAKGSAAASDAAAEAARAARIAKSAPVGERDDLELKPDRNGKPIIVTTDDLLFLGIPRSTFQNWVVEGSLRGTDTRGIYAVTWRGNRRIQRFCEAARPGGEAER